LRLRFSRVIACAARLRAIVEGFRFMLPDLRIVIAAVLSTFILTVGVGFFASSRLIHDQIASRLDSRSDDTPINRIALNWPEPTATEPQANLDFAVSARASRNPVRDVAPAAAEPAATQAPPVAPATTVANHAPPAPLPELPAASPLEPVAQTPEPPVAAASASDAVTAAPEEETPPAVESIATEAEAESARAPDARVTVYPDDQPATVESTGSIAAPPPVTPADPASDPQPKMSARTEADTDEAPPATASEPVITQQKAAPLVRKKRPHRAAARHRTAQRPAVIRPAAQNPQVFDFFGLFRNPPATLRLPPQTQAPASPAS
jgi:hypothetical protein